MTFRSGIYVAAFLLMSTWTVGCSSDQGIPAPLQVRNNGGATFDLFLRSALGGAESRLFVDIESGRTATISGPFPGAECISNVIVIARTKQGAEVGRLSGSICPGQLWVVGAPAASG